MSAAPEEPFWQWAIGGLFTVMVGMVGWCFAHLSSRVTRVEDRIEERSNQVADSANSGDRDLWTAVNGIKTMISDNRAHSDGKHAEILKAQGDMHVDLLKEIRALGSKSS